MKKYYMGLATFMLMFLASGCGPKDQVISRQNIVEENEIYDEFGVLFYRDLQDSALRVTMYDGNTYNYIEIGDTLSLQMNKKNFRRYRKYNMMDPEEMAIDPDSVLRKKNKMLENDSLTQARRDLLRKQLERNPIQIVASRNTKIK